MINKIHKADCNDFMQNEMKPDTVNVLYTDVPYNMGSEYIIDKEGHYCFTKSADFMGQWDAMDGRWWDRWFRNAYKVVKSGGFLVTHNIDRQADMWSYYARRNGFLPTQKLYWMFIDSFPKGVDLGLKIDNLLGVDREKVGLRKGAQSESTGRYGSWGSAEAKDQKMAHHSYLQGKMSVFEETRATSDMAKKYDGYKYGIAPFKQVLEEILVFWKRPEGNTNVPRQVRLFEERKKEGRPTLIHPSIFNIRDTRVVSRSRHTQDRWTPQLLIDDRLKPRLINKFGHEDSFRLTEAIITIPTLDDENWNYVKKATVEEKEWGLDDYTPPDYDPSKSKRKNTHPSPKPQALCKWVLKLFSLPDPSDMIIYDPFSGQGSIPLAAKRLGMQWIGTELDDEYFELAEAKLNHEPKIKQQELF